MAEKKITVAVTNAAKDWLGKKGYDPNLGARPLRRVIQSELLDPLALMIVEGKVSAGARVIVDAEHGKLQIKVGELVAAVA